MSCCNERSSSLMLCALLMLAAPLGAQPILHVESVETTQARPPVGGEAWTQFEAVIAAKPGKTESGRWARDVEVELWTAYRSRTNDQRYVYFHSKTAFVGIEEGERTHIFFYLPPEALLRDDLEPRPYAWHVSLSCPGATAATTEASASPNLRDPSRLSSFRSKARAGAAANEGALRPIHDSPFWGSDEASRQMRLSPAYLRKGD